MPGHYDRAVCATELRMRSEIIAKVNEGWRPSPAFEVPNDGNGLEGPVKGEGEMSLSSGAESTSETSLPGEEDAKIEDITQLEE